MRSNDSFNFPLGLIKYVVSVTLTPLSVFINLQYTPTPLSIFINLHTTPTPLCIFINLHTTPTPLSVFIDLYTTPTSLSIFINVHTTPSPLSIFINLHLCLRSVVRNPLSSLVSDFLPSTAPSFAFVYLSSIICLRLSVFVSGIISPSSFQSTPLCP